MVKRKVSSTTEEISYQRLKMVAFVVPTRIFLYACFLEPSTSIKFRVLRNKSNSFEFKISLLSRIYKGVSGGGFFSLFFRLRYSCPFIVCK